MDFSFVTQFIDATKVGGWVRAGVAAGLGVAIGKWPGLSGVLDPATQQAIGVAVAAVVVGVWSQLTKSDTAKLKAAAGVVAPDGTKTLIVTSPALAAATPAQENIVSHQDVKVTPQ